MSPAITLEELLAWSCQSSAWWKAQLDANPALLDLPCDINRGSTVQQLVRHIWVVDLFWAQRVTGRPQVDRQSVPDGPLQALYDLHLEGVRIFRAALEDTAFLWDETIPLDYAWMPPERRKASRRKLAAHALLHSQRHWAQLATLVRAAGNPSGFLGDMLFNTALD